MRSPDKIWASPTCTVYMSGAAPLTASTHEFRNAAEYTRTDLSQAAIAKAVEAEREENINAIKGIELLDGTNEPEDIAYMQGLYEAIAAIRARKGDAL